jgi:hypothetical protein
MKNLTPYSPPIKYIEVKFLQRNIVKAIGP